MVKFTPSKWIRSLVNPVQKAAGSTYDSFDFPQSFGRPGLSFYERQEPGVQIPRISRRYEDIYYLAQIEIVARTCIKAIREEIFRRGIEIKPKFWGSCADCHREYKNQFLEAFGQPEYEFETEGFPCPSCEKGSIYPPDHEQLKILKGFMDNCNKNGQEFIDVCRQLEDDLQTADDMYIILLKKYDFKDDGNVYSRLVEVIRGDPAIMRISADDKAQVGNYHFTCLIHRNFITTQKDDRCPECDMMLTGVEYVATHDGGKSITYPYIRGEVIHKSKYTPTMLYGRSPVLTAWYYITANLRMAKFISDYYEMRQVPSGALVVPALNEESVRKEMKKWKDELQRDPLYKPVIITHPDAKSKAEFIRLFDTLQEMEYTQVREEFRQRIGAIFGVSPILLADTSTGGGLNNEGLQITVTNRAVQAGQKIWAQVFRKIEDVLEITDWQLDMPISEEKDEMAEIQRMEAETRIAQMRAQLGYDHELNDEGHFIYSRRPVNPPEMEGEIPQAQEEEDTTDCVMKNMENLQTKHPDWSESKIKSRAEFLCRTKEQGTEKKPKQEIDPEKSRTQNPKEAGAKKYPKTRLPPMKTPRSRETVQNPDRQSGSPNARKPGGGFGRQSGSPLKKKLEF